MAEIVRDFGISARRPFAGWARKASPPLVCFQFGHVQIPFSKYSVHGEGILYLFLFQTEGHLTNAGMQHRVKSEKTGA